MAEKTPKAFGTGKIVSIVVIAVLVATVLFLVIQNLSLKSDVDDSKETAEGLTAEIEAVEKQLDEYEYALKDKDLDVERKQQMLNERDSLIQDKDDRIASLLSRNKISQQEAEKLRGRVEQLEHYVKKYQGQIDVLKVELSQKNAQIDSLHTVLGGTRDSLNSTTDDNHRLTIKNEAGKKLNAHSFAFFRFKQSGSTVQETEFRASQLDRLKICIDIAENVIAPKGEKVVYFQVLDAKGNVVRDESKTGFFVNNGEHVPYSAMTKLQFDNAATQVCAEMAQPNQKYESGSYTVRAFCEKFEIGHSAFEVK